MNLLGWLLVFLLAAFSGIRCQAHERASLFIVELGIELKLIAHAGIYMQTTEVTNAQYLTYLLATGQFRSDEKLVDFRKNNNSKPPASERMILLNNPELRWIDGKFPEGFAKHPVVLVTQEDATGFCKWLTNLENTRADYRLPTIKEWRAATYGPDEIRRNSPWGNENDPARFRHSGSLALLTARPVRLIEKFTIPVASLPAGATPDGIFDLWGNVGELVLASPKFPPDRLEHPMSTMIVGGSYADDLNSGQFTVDGGAEVEHGRFAADDVGFRIVCPVSRPELELQKGTDK